MMSILQAWHFGNLDNLENIQGMLKINCFEHYEN